MSVTRRASEQISELDLMTLKITLEQHVRASYLPALRRCIDAGLVAFDISPGRGSYLYSKGRLTEKGREAFRERAWGHE